MQPTTKLLNFQTKKHLTILIVLSNLPAIYLIVNRTKSTTETETKRSTSTAAAATRTTTDEADQSTLSALRQLQFSLPCFHYIQDETVCTKPAFTIDELRSAVEPLIVEHNRLADALTTNCSVAFVIPYRDRSVHLLALVYRLHQLLLPQPIRYRLFVVSQTDLGPFNRGFVKNVGFVEAGRLFPFQFVVFHDVDLLPERFVEFRCFSGATHFSSAINTWNYQLPYPQLIGGVFGIDRQLMYKLNGFSNIFNFWGGEDDGLWIRAQTVGLNVEHLAADRGRYFMLDHVKDKASSFAVDLLFSESDRMHMDGLNTLKKLTSKRPVSTNRNDPLYTNVSVDLSQSAGLVRSDQRFWLQMAGNASECCRIRWFQRVFNVSLWWRFASFVFYCLF